LFRQVVDEPGIFDAADAVIDASSAEEIEGFADVGGRGFFSGLGDRAKPTNRT